MSVKVGHRGRQKQSGSSEDNRETRKKETLFYRLRKKASLTVTFIGKCRSLIYHFSCVGDNKTPSYWFSGTNEGEAEEVNGPILFWHAALHSLMLLCIFM